MSSRIVTLDVREDLRNGREPFSKIMEAVAALGSAERLKLIAPFEPAPLYRVLAQQGFSHRATLRDSGDWEVLFTRGGSDEAGAEAAPGQSSVPADPQGRACAGPPIVEVDARGLEPPQPLVKILEGLAKLPAGAELRARTDRRPMHLYAQLEDRGFTAQSDEQRDGSFVTRIRRESSS